MTQKHYVVCANCEKIYLDKKLTDLVWGVDTLPPGPVNPLMVGRITTCDECEDYQWHLWCEPVGLFCERKNPITKEIEWMDEGEIERRINTELLQCNTSKIYLLTEDHRAEGHSVLGVFDDPIPDEKIRPMGIARSLFSEREINEWDCTYSCIEYPVESLSTLEL
jgi:hypothetical protein